MGNSRHDLSIPKDYFMKDKAKLLLCLFLYLRRRLDLHAPHTLMF